MSAGKRPWEGLVEVRLRLDHDVAAITDAFEPPLAIPHARLPVKLTQDHEHPMPLTDGISPAACMRTTNGVTRTGMPLD
jgi:hypothetical protein